jgi:hypothetical protein
MVSCFSVSHINDSPLRGEVTKANGYTTALSNEVSIASTDLVIIVLIVPSESIGSLQHTGHLSAQHGSIRAPRCAAYEGSHNR